MSSTSYGPFTVNNQEVCSGIYVQAGETLRILSRGTINFGSVLGIAAPVLDANGDDWTTPSDYPAPSLRKNSLICKIGHRWYQGGVDASFTPTTTGQLILFCNDAHPADNTAGWQITITRNSSDDADLPRPSSSGALFQSLSSNLQLVVTKRQSTLAGAFAGDLHFVVRRDHTGTGWFGGVPLTSGDPPLGGRSEVLPLDEAYLFPCWFQATDGWFWGACLQNRQVKYFACSMDGNQCRVVRDVAGASSCIGAPGIIQSRWGLRGNYELLVPTEAGGLDHFFAVNDMNSRCESNVRSGTDGLSWNRAASFGRGNPVKAVRLMHSSYGNLEAIATEEVGGGSRHELVFYWQNGRGGRWSSGDVLPNSTGRIVGIPAFVQSSFGTEFGNPGNLEVLAPAVDGGLLHWFRPHGGSWAWREADSRAIHAPGGIRYSAVHMTQGIYRGVGSRHGNFEVVAEVAAYPYGYSSLKFYWRNNAASVWNGPSDIPVP